MQKLHPTVPDHLHIMVRDVSWMSPYLGGTCITDLSNYMNEAKGDRSALYRASKFIPVEVAVQHELLNTYGVLVINFSNN